MGHEVSSASGNVEAMFHTPPWHGLGTIVEKDVTPMAALKIAHMDFRVEKRALYTSDIQKVPDHVGLCRSDNGRVLGVVGRHFSVVNNVDQASFLESLCSEGVHVECCGVLREGRRTFWTVRIPQNLIVTPGDEVERYLIVANGHDGSLAFKAFWSPIRVVCQNTLNAAIRNAVGGVSLRHTRQIRSRMEQAKQVLGLAGAYYESLGEKFRKLRAASLDEAGFQDYLESVLPIPDAEPASPQLTKAREAVLQNWRTGLGSDLAGRSFWAAYNGFAQWTSHSAPLRGNRPGGRFESVYLGSGRALQQRAFDVALEMIGAN